MTQNSCLRLAKHLSWLLAVTLAACTPPRLDVVDEGDWPAFGGDPGGQKYSSLTQINRDNVTNLEVAWTWETGEKPIPRPRQPIPGQAVRPASFQATPLVIDDVMYLSTPYNRVVALDADTGEEIWSYDPRAYEWGQVPNGTGFVHRGVAAWTGSDERRIFLNSRWRLIALDASTGEPIPSFGHRGALLHDSDNPKGISKLRFWGKNAESMESVSYQHSCNNAGRTCKC